MLFWQYAIPVEVISMKPMKLVTSLLLILALTISLEARGEDIVKPDDSPHNAATIALGQKLFEDKLLSATGTISCATCHDPKHGWSDGKTVSDGANGLTTDRNSPTLVGVAYQRLQFWDGRAEHLEGQALQPLTAINEMGPQTLAFVLQKVNGKYGAEFQEVFGGPATEITLAQAIASFERTIVARDAPIDRYLAGQTWALDGRQKHGYEVFVASGCVNCHSGPDFRTPKDGGSIFRNTGIAARYGDNEQGRYTITERIQDFNKFKIPTLREIGKSGPYMHNGKVKSLEEVVDHYRNPRLLRSGRMTQANLDPLVRPLRMTANQRKDLIYFLSTAFESYDYPNIPVTP